MNELDAIVVLLILFGVFNSMAKKAKQAREQSEKKKAQPQSVQQARPKSEKVSAAPAAPSSTRLERESMQPAFQQLRTSLDDRPQKEAYVGSLGVTSQEGEDPGHDHSLHAYRLPEQAAPIHTPLSFGGSDMVRAVVMSEILQRPCERRWGRR